VRINLVLLTNKKIFINTHGENYITGKLGKTDRRKIIDKF
jgi:hypothetical protein